ncbi:YciI family protein [Nocardia sp. NPDC051030]|uniref:YciI family protein n=1 Tax=Nocardia sp. NPDC051030 TaxID=3155162 RepID=UPI00342043BD
MKFMVLMYADPADTRAMSSAAREDVARRHEALHADVPKAMRNGAGLAYPDATMTLRLQNDRPVAVAAPLTSNKEQLTAYYVIECDNVDEAAAIAGRTLDFHVTAVEVREIHDHFGMEVAE